VYGWRALIGLIQPSGGPVAEEEFRLAAPEGVSFVTTRMYIDEVSSQGLEKMLTQVERAAKEISIMKADCLVLCGTPSGFFKGHDFNLSLTKRLEDASGLPSVTMATAVLDALRQLNLQKIAVATAYTEELDELLRKFLEEAGFEVSAIQGLRQQYNWDIARLPPTAVYRLTKEVMKAAEGADGIFISSGGLRTFEARVRTEFSSARAVCEPLRSSTCLKPTSAFPW
jgi:maleate isomerase